MGVLQPILRSSPILNTVTLPHCRTQDYYQHASWTSRSQTLLIELPTLSTFGLIGFLHVISSIFMLNHPIFRNCRKYLVTVSIHWIVTTNVRLFKDFSCLSVFFILLFFSLILCLVQFQAVDNMDKLSQVCHEMHFTPCHKPSCDEGLIVHFLSHTYTVVHKKWQ